MNFLEEYLELTKTEQWDKALPLIEYIISLKPEFDTSWFNYGVCLEALNRNDAAVQAFIRAYQLNNENYRAQYRIFRNLAISKNEDGFAKFLLEEVNNYFEVELLFEDDIFSKIVLTPQVKTIIENYFTANG